MADSASLDGAYTKLRRAKEHLEVFEAESVRILEDVPATLRTKATFDPDVPRFLVSVEEEPIIPDMLSAIAGDVIQNLRSALDHLAYQLPILATGEAWEETQWPIAGTDAELRNWRVKGLRKRLRVAGRSDLWAFVERYQVGGFVFSAPPEGVHFLTQLNRDAILFFLREFSNRDKHRLLLDHYVAVERYLDIFPRCIADCENPRPIETWPPMYVLKKSAPVLMQFTVDVTGPNPEMEVDINFIAGPIRFSQAGTDSALDFLVLMADKVGSILQDASQFFI